MGRETLSSQQLLKAQINILAARTKLVLYLRLVFAYDETSGLMEFWWGSMGVAVVGMLFVPGGPWN